MGLVDMTDKEFSDYCREVSAAYWAEEDEMKAGIHPTQIKERIEKSLYELGYQYEDISFLDWNVEGPRVRVSTDGSFFGVFNYELNEFESTPESRLTENIRLIQCGPSYGEVCH